MNKYTLSTILRLVRFVPVIVLVKWAESTGKVGDPTLIAFLVGMLTTVVILDAYSLAIKIPQVRNAVIKLDNYGKKNKI